MEKFDKMFFIYIWIIIIIWKIRASPRHQKTVFFFAKLFRGTEIVLF